MKNNKTTAVTIESTNGGFIVYDCEGEKYVIGAGEPPKENLESLIKSILLAIELLGYGEFISNKQKNKINITITE